MPTTTSASAAAASNSPTPSDSDEYEYEEIEVEVEEEVSDEEVNEEEEEEEGEEDEEEEEEAEAEAEEKGKDVSPPIDHEKGKRITGGAVDKLYNDKSSQPDGGITSVNTNLPVGVSSEEVKVSGESVIEVLKEDTFPPSKKETKGTNQDHVPPSEKETKGTNDDNVPPSEKETNGTTEDTFLSSSKETKGKNEDAFPPSEKETKGTNKANVPPSEKETKGANVQDIDDKHQKQPETKDGVSVRLDVVPPRRPRSFSPSKETKEGKKRQVLVCEFFAKGWCIKGNSCRFLHIKEHDSQSNSLNTPSNSAQMTKIPPSNHSSVWTSSTSMLFSSPSWKPNSFPTLKHMDADKELHDSRSVSETDHLYQNKASGDLYATRSFKYDWEPSKPFRSMFLLSQGLSPCSLYDPIRDSIDQPDFGVGVSKFSSSCQGPSTSSTHSPKNINPPVKEKETHDLDNGSERLSVASHDKDTGSSKTNPEKGNNNVSSHVDNGEMMETSEVKPGDENHKMIEAKGNEVMQRESKALRYFRGALIEFIKEIVKPAWREGNLSKEAHNRIVKKAADKVLSTLPVENVPSTEDSVDFYLSSCQPKLVKLVEGYISKYGKS